MAGFSVNESYAGDVHEERVWSMNAEFGESGPIAYFDENKLSDLVNTIKLN